MAGQSDIDEFNRLAMEIVKMAVDYASANEWSEIADANIRSMRMATNVLLSALQQAGSVTRPPVMPSMAGATGAVGAPAETPRAAEPHKRR